MGFWSDFGGFWEGKWRHVDTKSQWKNEINFEKRFCWICMLSLGENHFFYNSGGRSWKKNRSKIDENSQSRWEGILASIFEWFWLILGGKLGRKTEPRAIQKGIEKWWKNVCRQDVPKTTKMRFLGGGSSNALGPRIRRGEGRVGCTKPTYPQETHPLQQNYLSDRNLLRKSVKCDKWTVK